MRSSSLFVGGWRLYIFVRHALCMVLWCMMAPAVWLVHCADREAGGLGHRKRGGWHCRLMYLFSATLHNIRSLGRVLPVLDFDNSVVFMNAVTSCGFSRLLLRSHLFTIPFAQSFQLCAYVYLAEGLWMKSR